MVKTIYIKIIFLIFVLFFTESFPQIDSTRKEFFPLQIGNFWQYRNQDNNLANQEVVGDTILDGYKYYLLYHPLRSTGGILRIDSLFRLINRWGGPYWGDTCGGNTPYESSVYHLGEKKDSSIWNICETFTGHLGERLVRFNRIRTMNIFGEPREVMEFNYGGYVQGEDTVWSFGAIIAKGIGIIEEEYYDWASFILQGAIIDGKKYGTIVSVNNNDEIIPDKLILLPNYPNPFNPATKIKYELPERTNVSLKIFDVLGKQVAELVNEIQLPGIYEKEFDASKLSSGVYIYRITATKNNRIVFNQSRQMLLMK